jgi:UDP-N-acetylenolpyruvoylglucosamine reductase
MTVGGVRLGGAHINRMLTSRSATAADILLLCRRARDQVHVSTGYVLESAFIFVDRDGLELKP